MTRASSESTDIWHDCLLVSDTSQCRPTAVGMAFFSHYVVEYEPLSIEERPLSSIGSYQCISFFLSIAVTCVWEGWPQLRHLKSKDS